MPVDPSPEVLLVLNNALPYLLIGGVIVVIALSYLFGRAWNRNLVSKRAKQTVSAQRKRELLIASKSEAAGRPGDGFDAGWLAVRLRNLALARDRMLLFSLGGLAIAGVVWFITQRAGFEPIFSGLIALILAILAPISLRAHLRARWLKRFAAEFPSALDRIIRGLRAGLPMMECVALVATESRPEIAGAFREVLNDYAIGVPIEQSLKRMSEKIPIDELRFFTIVIALQSQTGGGLADMLETLADTLRKRKELADKVQIMSQEARSSAAIIGSLPILVAGVLFMVSPEYVSILFTTTAGLIAITVAGLWMLLGIQVMRSMIGFDS